MTAWFRRSGPQGGAQGVCSAYGFGMVCVWLLSGATEAGPACGNDGRISPRAARRGKAGEGAGMRATRVARYLRNSKLFTSMNSQQAKSCKDM